MLNVNCQIQDAEGSLVADLWKNGNGWADGKTIVSLLNQRGLGEVVVVPEASLTATEVVENLVGKKTKSQLTSERMKEYWRKKREITA